MKTPFFCVHGIGGEVQVYARLARHFDPDRPFFGLRMLPVARDDAFPSIEEMAARYVTALRATVPSGPYIVGGYSSGATVAFEMARQLTAAGERVSLVAALDSGLPNNRRGVGLNARSLIAFTRNAFWWMTDDFMQTGRGEFARRVRSKAVLLASRVAAVPGLRWLPHGSPDIRDRLGIPGVPKEWSGFLARHFTSLMTYVPRAYSGRAAFFRARAWPLLRFHEPDAGWGRMAAGGVDITVVPGSHDSILREPYVRALAAALSRSFDAVDRAAQTERSRSPRLARHAHGSR
jgi:thioesterase domain-containing protein